MQINTNLGALNVQGALSKNSLNLSTSMERLSTGLRVNSAIDDAAGLAIGDRMNSQIRGMTVAVRNANDGISMAQTAESAMGTITDTLQRMRDLGVQAANMGAVGSGDRQKLQLEFKQLGAEISRIISNTTFNDKKILAGSMKGANFQIGAGTATNNQISITVSNLMSVSGIKNVASATAVSIGSGATSTKIKSAIDFIDLAIKKVDNFRATLGAVQ
ncbi:MAG: flagellin N-terminal helical domain-containing protein, partial [Methylobacter sp.]